MRIWNRMTRLSSNSKFFAPKLKERAGIDASSRYTIRKLPPQYQKFYNEWTQDSTPVHWIPSTVNWERDQRTLQTTVVRDRPIPVRYPHQVHEGIWGGEGVIDGLVKKAKYRSPVPKFWVPSLQRSVLYSEILDSYLSVIVTERALRLIDEHNGFDAYLLKNPANELRSLLALKLKRKILLALATKDFSHDEPEKQSEILEKYKEYIIPVDEVEWYGLSIKEAKAKFQGQLEAAKVNAIKPLKLMYRQELIDKLKAELANASAEGPAISDKTSWLNKLNPFSKPEEKSRAS